jgi:heme/copper-type cytochrome/quinol oxidase subunit 2
VKLRSKDVIHSFGVPEFRVKQDAVPGLTIPIWFIPNVTTADMRAKTGNSEFQYEIACAQLCGLGHAHMRGFVTVLGPDEFQKWMDDKVKESVEPNRTRSSSASACKCKSRWVRMAGSLNTDLALARLALNRTSSPSASAREPPRTSTACSSSNMS